MHICINGVSISLLIIPACFYSQFIHTFITSVPFLLQVIPCVALLTVCAYLHFQCLTACVFLLTFLAEAAPQHWRMEAELVLEQAWLVALQEVHLVELAAKE